jgi:hypothetical protein
MFFRPLAYMLYFCLGYGRDLCVYSVQEYAIGGIDPIVAWTRSVRAWAWVRWVGYSS